MVMPTPCVLLSTAGIFQYSLCRVVLMVTADGQRECQITTLSVLALSSRFDGPATPSPR